MSRFLFIIFFLNPFQVIISQIRHLNVDLKKEVTVNIDFDEDLVDFEFYSLANLKKYENAILLNYKGIPKSDSLKIYIYNLDNTQFYFDIYREKYVEKEKFLKFIKERNIDTLNLSNKPINQKLVAIIGFEKGKQFIITDSNRNENFNDDIKYEYKNENLINSEGNFKNLDKLPLSTYNYDIFINGKIQTYSRKFIPYPYSSHVFSQTLPLTEKKYLSFIKFRDYWKGSTMVNNKSYDFFIQAIASKYAVIYIKQKDISLSNIDKAYNRQFMHRLKDTIILGNNSFVIDSLNSSISKLYLTNIEKKSNNFGYSIGETINNFELQNLENKTFRLYDISKNKKYTLIEFWGTWCGPCREMMPKIKNAANSFSTKLNILSIAVDKNLENVIEFTKENKMNWSNAYLNLKSNNQIINDLRIQIYPTFILLDSKGKIEWRGSSNSFDEILKILSK